ncbi:MAG: magnesium chelatase subunit D family protein [Chloroflexota bacterium]|nr:magnesium chelatase subunit D family protein [Chloroflexota bacterium]
MKRALLLNTVNPRIGGVLIRGKKGTAKSTAVRSLAALLPQVTVLQGCPYSCSPEVRQGLCQWCETGSNDNPPVSHQVRIVDLPVGASEDRLVGSLDIEQAIKTGTKSFEPGLIAAAHRGILYIDEVNLLNDHLVDVLLDASAMGRNYVEREGISVSHSAEFILVGTMNPEEGDLRPQLLDRFGLAVEVDGIMAAEERREVVRRRMAYEANPVTFMELWDEEEERERERLLHSRALLDQVTVSDDILGLITDICAEYQVDGLRGDIVMYKTASTIAAYDGRTEVDVEDVREAALLALLHRQRRQPFQQPHLVTEQLDNMLEEYQNQPHSRESQDDSQSPSQERNEDDSDPPDLGDEEEDNALDSGAGPQDQWFETGDPYAIQSILLPPPDRRERPSSGRRATTVSGSSAGRYVRAQAPQGSVTDLALDATLRAAAPYQLRRRENLSEDPGAASLVIEPWDVREKVRETKTGSLILFVVDASGSMGAQRRMVAVKGAVLSLLLDAYQRRDRVALIGFRGTGADLLLPPTNSVDLAQLYLQDMPTGGRTPLSRGLYLALETLETERMKDRNVLPLIVLLSDGRANVALDGSGANSVEEAHGFASIFDDKHITSVVIDTELDFIKLQMAQPLAEAMGARYLKLEELRADSLADAVRRELPGTDSVAETEVNGVGAEEMRRVYENLNPH